MSNKTIPLDKRYVISQKSFNHIPCWEWIGLLSNNGYGRISVDRKILFAHRYFYEMFVGKIPDGYVIDHLCSNTKCVNPKHLEAVTKRENVLRSQSFTGKNHRKTHCKRGHPLNGDNLLKTKDGRRQCRVCINEKSLAYYHATKGDVDLPCKDRMECPRGHQYTADNTTICRRGKRSCKKCRALAQRAYILRSQK